LGRFSIWVCKVRVVYLGWSRWGVQVGGVPVVNFLVSSLCWSKPPHHEKVNLLGEDLCALSS
jgi:hypothetical protein